MTTAWTKGIVLGLLLTPVGCVLSVNDDPYDGFGGNGGTSGVSGSAGSAGRSGSAGSSGSAGAGLGGTGGTSGDFPAPTCDEEPGDDVDECVQCFKRNCCEQWIGCDDQSCTDEWVDVAECMVGDDAADADTLGMCISESSAAADGFVQQNTQALIDCALAPADDAGIETLCSSECFGVDIYLD